MAGVEQNRYKTNNGCIKHLPQTGIISRLINIYCARYMIVFARNQLNWYRLSVNNYMHVQDENNIRILQLYISSFNTSTTNNLINVLKSFI